MLENYQEQLKTIPLRAAESVGYHLRRASLEEYIHFLDHMYHYTKRSEENLRNAAHYSHTKELKDYFEHMAREERGHYLLAQRDLEEFGVKPSLETPWTVNRINKFWDEQSVHHHGNAYLGIVYVFENVAQHVGGDIMQLLTRLAVTKRQSRWLLVHAEADLDHGSEAEALMLKYLPENPSILLAVAGEACELWIELMKEAFTIRKDYQLVANQ